jgi:hypothetical protein
MNTDHNNTRDTETEPAEVARTIERLQRRIRTRSRILTGEGLAHGHGESAEQVAARDAEQRATLDELTVQLSYWESIRDHQSEAAQAVPSATFDYVVPVDPMDDLQCDGCQ